MYTALFVTFSFDRVYCAMLALLCVGMFGIAIMYRAGVEAHFQVVTVSAAMLINRALTFVFRQ